MGRIEEIKERVNQSKAVYIYDGVDCVVTDDVQYLLSLIQIASEQLTKIKDKAQIIASHCAVQMDRGGNVGSSYAFEKTQEIYEMLGEALEQIKS